MEKPITLITGTRRGIDRFLAEHYRQGHHVVGCSRREASLAVDGYAHFVADVTDEKAMLQLFAAIRARYGTLQHLINNAGIASMNHSLLTFRRSTTFSIPTSRARFSSPGSRQN